MTAKPLFTENHLSSVLRAQVDRMKQAIETYNPAALQATEIDDLVQRFVGIAHVEPIHLQEDAIKAEQRTVKVNVSGRFDYAPGMGRGPVLVDGIEVTLRVPFAGDAQLFRLSPSRLTFSPPYGVIVGSSVVLSDSGPPPEAARIKADLERALESLKQHVGWSRSDVINHIRLCRPKHAPPSNIAVSICPRFRTSHHRFRSAKRRISSECSAGRAHSGWVAA